MRWWLRRGMLVVVVAVFAMACTGSEATSGTVDDGSAIVWESCGDIQCGSLTVPLDHDDPEGETIELALTRAPATGDKIGSVLVNFGGPSAESGELMAGLGNYFVEVFGGGFDVVSWDARGIGNTERLSCDDFAAENFSVGLVRLEDGLEDELVEGEASFQRLVDCATASGPIVDHLSTVDAVRDLDLLRAAVGDDQLTYVGFSYGTMIGWVYGTLFPTNIRAMVLDGASPTAWTLESFIRQNQGFERTFNEFAAWCDDNADQCLASDEGLGARFDRLVEELDVAPLDLGGDERFEAHDLVRAVADVMYVPPADIAPGLDRWLADVDAGDASGFIEFSALSSESLTPGAFKAVLCADGFPLATVERSTEFMSDLVGAAPRFGRAASGIRCDLWPGEINPLPELDTAGSAPMLVIGNTLDPATPYEDAVELDRLLANSVLLTYEGAGHTIVGANACIDELVVDYLVRLELPPPGTRCN